MATAIGDQLSVELVLDLKDYKGEEGRVVIPLAGEILDGVIIDIVDEYIAATNVLVTPSINRKYGFTGYDTTGRPKDGTHPQALLAALLAMEFQKVSPLNSSKTVTKQIALPGYVDALSNDAVIPHVPVTGNSNFNSLTANLADELDFVAADGAHYPGGWTFNPGSKFGTKLTVTDGQ